MKRAWLIAAAAAVLLAWPGLASADSTLFCSGDPNRVNALANENNDLLGNYGTYGAAVYDNFKVSGGNWTVSGLFTLNEQTSDFGFSGAAYYSIRTGVSNGNGGTIIAQGITAAAQTLDGFNNFGKTGYRTLVSGLNIVLIPGQYWLTVVPYGAGLGAGRSFQDLTSFANCVDCGAHTGNDSFFDSTFYGANFAPASNFVGGTADFSMGVIGTTSGGQTPEPVSLLLLGSGLLVLAGAIRKGVKT
jgi:hypothetical protein